MKLGEFYRKLQTAGRFAELDKPIVIWKDLIRKDGFHKIEEVEAKTIDISLFEVLLRPLYYAERTNRIISLSFFDEELNPSQKLDTMRKVTFILNKEESFFTDAITEFRLKLFYYED